MNEKFFSLPVEKQHRIINAVTEVFGKNEYKRASTDLIAHKAGISKGLLFYYFKNKRELYLFAYNHLITVMKKLANDSGFLQITDFFELLEYFSRRKLEILECTPYILEFSMRAFYSEKEDVSGDLKDKNMEERDKLFQMYFSHIDMSKFKEGIDPYKIYKILVWMTDGYLHERQMNHQDWNLDALMKEFKEWINMMKVMVYKEGIE